MDLAIFGRNIKMLVISSMSNSFSKSSSLSWKCPTMMTRHRPRSSRTLDWLHSRGMRPQSPVGKKRTMRQTPPNIRNSSSFSTILPLLPHSCWYPFCYSSLWLVLCFVSLTYSTAGCPKTLLTCGVFRSYIFIFFCSWLSVYDAQPMNWCLFLDE